MSEAKRLDPDARHTVLEMMDGGVRIQPIKVGEDEARAWAKKNKVDVPAGPNWLEVINTARMLRNLPPYKIIAPATVTPLTPAATRDGQPSVAVAQQVHVDRPGDVDMRVATDWAKANRIVWDRVTPKFIDQINEERRRLKLPLFRVKPKRGGAAITSPGQDALTRLPVPVRSSSPIVSTILPEMGDEGRWKTLPTTAADLYTMATSFVDTISGIVTPEMAKVYLGTNVENRPLSAPAVARFVEILRSGRWINTGEPLIISNTGVLNDGQHRLTAVAESGIPAEMDIRFGIPREAFTSTGTGLRRTNGHILAIAGRQYSNMQGPLCRLVTHYDRGQMQKLYDGIDGDEAVRMTEENADIGRVAALLRSLKFKPNKNGAFGFILLIGARELGFEKAEEFAGLVIPVRASRTARPVGCTSA